MPWRRSRCTMRRRSARRLVGCYCRANVRSRWLQPADADSDFTTCGGFSPSLALVRRYGSAVPRRAGFRAPCRVNRGSSCAVKDVARPGVTWANLPRRQRRMIRRAGPCFDPDKPAIEVAVAQTAHAAISRVRRGHCPKPRRCWVSSLSAPSPDGSATVSVAASRNGGRGWT